MTQKKVINCIGLTCPQPVLMAKEALETIDVGIIVVVVDNEASRSNVERFGKSQGCEVAVTEEEDTFHLVITKSSASSPDVDAPAAEEYVCDIPAGALVYVIASDTMGEGDDELGRVLMRAFIKTMKEISPMPAKILFYNSGVHLTSRESDLIEPLRALEKQGVEILSCGTCLDFFNSKNNLLVGKMTNMYEIMDSMVNCVKVVSPL